MPAAAPVRALPGALDATPVLNSNNPELVKEGGVLVSTLAGGGSNLDFSFLGPFEVFAHHIAETAFLDGNDTCWIGLVAHNDGTAAADLRLLAGSSWLSSEAPFISLDPVVDDPRGGVFSGPGGRVAADWLANRSSLEPTTWTIEPGARRVILSEPIPAKNFGVPSRNARSALLRLEAGRPVRLAYVALFGRLGQPPADAGYLAVLQAGRRAGPPERAATPYEPPARPTSGTFIYGRVGGVTLGARWTGRLFERASEVLAAPGDQVGFPIASLALNTLGTGQVQVPAMARRYPEAPPEGHGSYGVTYDLQVPLDNPDQTPRRYALTLSHPQRLPEGRPGKPTYVNPAGRPVTFRGPVRFDYDEAPGRPRRVISHVVLRDGEQGAPFATVTVPPGGRTEGRLTLVYPADCTPPQLLTVARLP